MRTTYLNRANAFYRLSAKAERNGQYRNAKSYRDTADRLLAQHYRHVEYTAALAAARKGGK